MSLSESFWADRRVLVTGHTGFKGAWLSIWLTRLGAQVHGFSLPDTGERSLFADAGVGDQIVADHRGDLRDSAAVHAVVNDVKPSVVLHLGAQSLVSVGHASPAETFDTNVMGTVHVCEAIRASSTVEAAVLVTSDKCYRPTIPASRHRETDALGGHDPYSASKAAAEIVAEAWIRSYPDMAPMATARAGNVIGGGDWAANRLLPDCARAFAGGLPVTLRSPESTRPWQHVLDPLHGYLVLTEWLTALPTAAEQDTAAQRAWNFGPDVGSDATVHQVSTRAAAAWGGSAEVVVDTSTAVFSETGFLSIESGAAIEHLGWSPTWAFDEAVSATMEWYRRVHEGASPMDVCGEQLDTFTRAVQETEQ